MFNLSRYFATLSLILIGLAAGLLGLIYREVSVRQMTMLAEDRNVAMAQVFENALGAPLASLMAASVGKDASMLKEAGIDIINVSTGQVTTDEEPIYGRMFQAPFADQIRNEVGMPTIVAGNITTADQANTLVAAGRTDIVAFGRAIMNDPHFVLRAAAHYGHKDQYWAPQYLSGKFLAEILADKENEEMLELRTAAKPPNPGEALAIAIARGELLQK